MQRGRVYSGDALSIASNGAFENAGQLVSGKALSITAGSIVSNGQLGSVTGALTLTSQNDIALQGVVSAATTLQATAGATFHRQGRSAHRPSRYRLAVISLPVAPCNRLPRWMCKHSAR